MSKPAVFALVDNESQASTAMAALEAVGFTRSDISVLTQSAAMDGFDADPDLALTEEGMVTTGVARTREVGHTNSTKAPEGATTGGVTGGAIGAIAGWAIGIGALAIPGVGPFIAAGPIMAALSGAAIGAAAGGVAGGLIGYGIPEYEAKLYADRLKAGHILMGVHTIDSDEASAARKAFESAKAHDIKTTSEVEA